MASYSSILKERFIGTSVLEIVKLVVSFGLMFPVLYSKSQRTWKIADFGLMSEGTSAAAVPTTLSRGKDGYRAPEVLSNSSYNNKVDIWAFGCILFELCVGKKAFSSDWAALDHWKSKKSVKVDIGDAAGPIGAQLQTMISAMLDLDPAKRPSAALLCDQRKALRRNPGLPLVVREKHKLCIGIDLGTTFTGVAFSIPGLNNGEIIVVRSWPGSMYMAAEKIPTALSYDTTPPSWGFNIKSRHELRVAHFKLGLEKNVGRYYSNDGLPLGSSSLDGFLIDHDWCHPCLPHMTAVDYTADFLKAVVGYVEEQVLPRQYGLELLKHCQMAFVSAVPAIWTDEAKDRTRRAAVKAGIPGNSMTFITEPEAAALLCRLAYPNLNWRDGEQFLVCDAGGGTTVLPHSIY